MRNRLLPALAAFGSVALLAGQLAAQQVSFDDYFTDGTMRVDYYHTGGNATEIVSLDRVVSDGPWPGSRTRLIDDTGFGKYFFKVRDAASGRLLYSRGFASLFGEWETIGEEMHRTFHESVRFPWPREPVRITLEKRTDAGDFTDLATIEVDPASRSVNKADLEPRGEVWALFEHGPPGEKVDLVVVSAGYTEEELPKFHADAERLKFHADAERLVGELFSYEPFKGRKSDFNVWVVDLPSPVSGVTRPHSDRWRRTPLSSQYGIFDSERYLLTPDNRAMRDALSAAPYEFVAVLVNAAQYGGGGIYNWQAVSSVDSEFSDYVFVHEFGHHFAGLADEYYTSSVAYETGGAEHPEPWEANATALHDPQHIKWGDLVEPGTPLPTPWPKAEFEEHSRRIRALRQELIDGNAPEADFDALFREQREIERQMLSSGTHADHVGAFEGASYEARGLYRPEQDCIMFSRNMHGFCRVCRRAIERIIELYVGI
jgi:hypothetical protein